MNTASLEKFLIIGVLVTALALIYTSVANASGMDSSNMQAHMQRAQTSLENMSKTSDMMENTQDMLDKASAMGQSIERSQAMMDNVGLMSQSMERAQNMMSGASQMSDSMDRSQEMMDNMSEKVHSMDRAQMMQDMEQYNQFNDKVPASLMEHFGSDIAMNESVNNSHITE